MKPVQPARHHIVIAVFGTPETDLGAAIREGGRRVDVVDGAGAPGALRAEAADAVVIHCTASEAGGAAALVSAVAGVGSAPVLAVLEGVAPGFRETVLEAGAADLVQTPCSGRELRLRLDRLLESGATVRRLEERATHLERMLAHRSAELEDARIQILERLARAAEYRDDETGDHTRRVGALAGAVAAGLGVPESEVELITRAAPLHDVGKIGIPDGILLKPGRLTPKEVEVMQAHTTIGAQMLSGTDIPQLNLAATIALTHHERWDGHGYPEGTRGTDIPLVGRIVAVADVFDALTTKRPYKRAWDLGETVAELEALRGTHLDPDATDIALTLVARNALPSPIQEHVQPLHPWDEG